MSRTPYLDLNIPDKSSKGFVVTDVFDPNFTKLDQEAERVNLRKMSTEDNIEELKKATRYKVDDVVEVLGYYAKGDARCHKRVAKNTNDGSGELGQGGIWWCTIINEDKIVKFGNDNLKKYIGLENKVVINEDFYVDKLDLSNLKTEGNSEIFSENRDMIFNIETGHSNRNPRGGFNCNYLSEKDVNTLRSIIVENRPLKIVIFGDSISSPSFDFYSYQTNYNYRIAGVDTKDNTASLGSLIVNELINTLKVDFSVHSRSIPGLSVLNIDELPPSSFEGLEGVNMSQSWKQNIMNVKPDIIIHTHGMNSGEEYYAFFLNKWQDWLKTQYHPFIQIFMTTPQANFKSTASGDFTSYFTNTVKHIVNGYQRKFAKECGSYCIDVASNYNNLVLGADFRNGVVKQKEDLLAKIIRSNGAEGSFPNTATSGDSIRRHDLNSIFFSVKGSFNLSDGFLNSNSNIGINFFSETNIQIVSNGSTLTLNMWDYTARGTLKTEVISRKNVLNFKLDVLPTMLILEIDNKKVLIKNPAYKGLGTDDYNIKIVGFGENFGNTFLNLEHIKSLEFTSYEKTSIANDFWAKSSVVSEWNDDVYGGGVNHPSTRGLLNVYLPPIREFVNDVNVFLNSMQMSDDYFAPAFGIGVDKGVYVCDLPKIQSASVFLTNVRTGEQYSVRATTAGAYNEVWSDVLDVYTSKFKIYLNDVGDKYEMYITSSECTFVQVAGYYKVNNKNVGNIFGLDILNTFVKLPFFRYTPLHVTLDTPYHATQMSKLGILDPYHNYLTDLHEYEKQQNTQSDTGVMNLNILQPPVIPTKVEEYAKEYNLI
ncbi:MAG: hypothetical protein ACRCX2_04120 [Paraclostridium sp.]